VAKSLDIVVTGLDKIIQKLAAYPTAAKAAIGRGLKAGALVLVREVKETIYLGHAQGHLQGDKGLLRNSITWRVDEGASEAQVGTNVIYAPIHEFGGTIRPKGHPYLAIPIGTYKGWPRTHNDLHSIQSEGGNPLLADPSGKPQYVLRREVTIPPRPYLKPAIDNKGAEAAAQITNALYEVLRP